MAYSLEQIFHTDPKVIGMIEIYSNPMDRKTVNDIEKVIKSIAKNLKVNLDNIPSGETLRVYIYPTKRVFYSIFGYEVEKNMRKARSRSQESMLFVVGEGEIHMVSPRVTGSSYTNVITLLVKNILEEYEQESKVKKAQEQVKAELEPEEKIIVEDEEEIEDPEEELEEELEEDLELDDEKLAEVEVIDQEIEKIREEKGKDIPEWLDLGWIMYKRGILKNAKNKADYADFISKKGVTSQGKISQSQSVIADYNYASESASAIVEYIVENYGARKILELFENPNVEQTLGISKAKFSRECKESIKKKYVNSKLIQMFKEKENAEKEVDVKEKETK